MLKIAVISEYLPSALKPWQGRSLYETLRVMSRHADVRVFHAVPAYPPSLRRGNRNVTGSEFSPSGVPVSYSTFPALPVVSRVFNGNSLARTLFDDVRGFGPDLLWGCFIYPDGYAAVKIARALSVPVVVMGLGSDINRIRDPFTSWQTRKVLRSADFVVTVSEDLRKKAVALGARPAKTRAIINGCDLSIFRVRNRSEIRRSLGIAPSAKVIVFIGRLDVNKGLRELVESAAMLHLSRPDLHTYIVGEGPDRSLIQRQIEVHAASEYVHLNPPCNFDDVAQWMAASDLVTLPSYMEGCPNVILEALASGRPIVATAVGGIPEITGDECLRLVRPKEVGELARALDGVLDKSWDPERISALCSRSWESVADELLEVFQTLTPRPLAIRTRQQIDASSVTARSFRADGISMETRSQRPSEQDS
jgi:glycosyltransferase involved in cell wall biosynthesis